jgi:hypothetical protein
VPYRVIVASPPPRLLFGLLAQAHWIVLAAPPPAANDAVNSESCGAPPSE